MDTNIRTKYCPQCGGEMVKSGSKYKCKFCGYKESARTDKGTTKRKAVTSISIGGIALSVFLSVGGRYARQIFRENRLEKTLATQEALADFTYTPNWEDMPTFDYDFITHPEDGVISSPTLTSLLEFMFGEDIWESQGVLTAEAEALTAEVKYLSFYGNFLEGEIELYYGFEDYRNYPNENALYGDEFNYSLIGLTMQDTSYFSDYEDFLFAELDCFPNVTLLESNGMRLSSDMELPALTALYYDQDLSDVVNSGLPVSQLEALYLESPSSLEHLGEFQNIKHLELSCDNLTSLDGIESLTLLESLSIYDCHIADLSPLGNLTSLKNFYLTGDEQVKDLSFLEHLPNLSNLWLIDTAILNLDFLAGHTDLTLLYLTGNSQLTDFSALEYLSELDSLHLDITSLTGDQPDVSVIGRLSNLNSLSLVDVYDVSFLKELSNLAYLSLDTALDTSIAETISHMTDLEVLNLTNCGESSLEHVKLLGKLEHLSAVYVEHMELSGDMTGLFELPGLNYLSVANCRFYEPISSINWPSDLIWLDISGVNFFDITDSYGGFYTAGNENTQALQSFISFLGDCTSLQYLYAGDCTIEDTSFLGNLTSLVELDVSNCNIDGFEPDSISLCTGMLYMNIGDNTITSLDDLSGMKDLVYLYMENNYVTDLTPLVFCESLYYVNTANNPISINPLPSEVVDTEILE